MSNDVNSALAKAFELIEANRQDEARNLLEPLLATERNNPDVWWMYAHAVSDPVQAQQALQNVVRISPAYPGAATLLQQTEAQLPASQQAKPGPQSLAGKQSAETFGGELDDEFVFEDEEDDLDFDLDDFDEEGELEAAPSRRRSLLPILLTLALVVVLVIVFVVINPFADDDEPTAGGDDATPIASIDETQAPQVTVADPQSATDEPGETADVATEPVDTPDTATEAPAQTEEVVPGSDDYSAFYTALAPLSVVADSASVESTAFGDTLLFDICTVPGSAFRDTLDLTMETLASQSGSLADEIGGIGARFVDCEADQALNVLAVSSDDAVAFNDGLIDFDQYRSRWQPIG